MTSRGQRKDFLARCFQKMFNLPRSVMFSARVSCGNLFELPYIDFFDLTEKIYFFRSILYLCLKSFSTMFFVRQKLGFTKNRSLF